MAVQQLDLGNVLLQAAQLRALGGQQQRAQRFNALAPQIAAGDEGAARQGLAVDPQSTMEIIKGIAALDERGRAVAKQNVELLGRAAAAANTPQKWDAMISLLGQQSGTQDFERYRGAFQNRDIIIGQLREVSNAIEEIADPTSPTGTRFVHREDAVGKPGKPPTGMEISTGPDGTTIRTNVRDGGLTKTTLTRIEDKQFQAGEALARMRDIRSAFRPEFQEIGTRLGTAWSGLKEKAGVQLTAEERKTLNDFAIHRRRAISNVNQVLRDMSGAAITPQEADRLTKGLPNPGTGVFDGDSPTEFRAKMDDVTREMTLASMRYSYARRNGLDPLTLNLVDMSDIIAREETTIREELRGANPNASPDVIETEVMARMDAIFGGL